MSEGLADRINRIAYEQNITPAQASRIARISERMDKAKAARNPRNGDNPMITEPEHTPCCSSHGVPMTCERYRYTHFVQVRPCCSADAERLKAEREAVIKPTAQESQIAAVLGEHERHGRKSWGTFIVCTCESEWTGTPTEHRLHVAAMLAPLITAASDAAREIWLRKNDI